MTHFVKFYILSALIFVLSYAPVFYIETNVTFRIFKATNNIITFVYPLVIFYFLIRNYKGKVFSYTEKAGHLGIFLTYLCVLFIIVKLINPAHLQLNKEEEEIGGIAILIYHGIFQFAVGLIMLIFTKQKDSTQTSRQGSIS
jgi:hypothetical protein